MKIKPKIYAKALADLIFENKSPAEQKKIIGKFLRFLEKKGDIKKAKEIILLAEREILKKTGNKRVFLETARKIKNGGILKKIAKKGDIVEEKISPDLIAGIKITINGDRQLDFSLKGKLDKLF